MEALLNGCSLVFLLWKPSSFTAPEIIVGLQYFRVHYVFSLITSIILPSSAIYFHILFCNGLAVPKNLSNCNNNCTSNSINHPGATCMHLVPFFAFLIRARQDQMGCFDIILLPKENCQVYLPFPNTG